MKKFLMLAMVLACGFTIASSSWARYWSVITEQAREEVMGIFHGDLLEGLVALIDASDAEAHGLKNFCAVKPADSMCVDISNIMLREYLAMNEGRQNALCSYLKAYDGLLRYAITSGYMSAGPKSVGVETRKMLVPFIQSAC